MFTYLLSLVFSESPWNYATYCLKSSRGHIGLESILAHTATISSSPWTSLSLSRSALNCPYQHLICADMISVCVWWALWSLQLMVAPTHMTDSPPLEDFGQQVRRRAAIGEQNGYNCISCWLLKGKQLHTPELLKFHMCHWALSKNLVHFLVKFLLNFCWAGQEIHCPGAHCKIALGDKPVYLVSNIIPDFCIAALKKWSCCNVFFKNQNTWNSTPSQRGSNCLAVLRKQKYVCKDQNIVRSWRAFWNNNGIQ